MSVAHELAAREFVCFAPRLEPLRVDAEVEVRCRELAGIEAGFLREGVADLGRDLGSRERDMPATSTSCAS